MEFHASRQAQDELSGLIYWMANLEYTRERYPGDREEIEHCKKSVECSFRALDRLGVPFWVQNAALGWARSWKNYVQRDFWTDMTARGIVRAAA